MDAFALIPEQYLSEAHLTHDTSQNYFVTWSMDLSNLLEAFDVILPASEQSSVIWSIGLSNYVQVLLLFNLQRLPLKIRLKIRLD